MAEFLIFVRSHSKTSLGPGHWLGDDPDVYINLQAKISNDPSLTTAQKTKNLEVLRRKYESVQRYGDIIDIRPNGYYDLHGWDTVAFALVKVPVLDDTVARTYLAKLEDAEGNLLRKRRFNVSALNLSVGEVRTISKLKDVNIIDKGA